MRVGILALLHESNTFVSGRTALERFEECLLLSGEDVREMAGAHHEVGGFFEGLASAGFQAVPILAARAVPSGVIESGAFERLLRRMFDRLENAGRLDGLLVAAHGATVSELERDADGYWLARLRHTVGPDVPIVVTLDPHANLSPRMVEASQALVSYRTNPHLDQRGRGVEAALLLVRTLRGEVRPRQAAAFPPLAINIERQNTSESPCLPLYELAERIRGRPGVLSVSINLGFPYADVEEMGASTLVVADGDGALAERAAAEIATHLWTHRREFQGELAGIDPCLDRARDLDGPVCLLDMGDNVGGGSPGDGTLLAHAILGRGLRDSFVCLFDPVSARKAIVAGEGRRLRLAAGGRTDALHGPPLVDDFTVISLADGRFEEPEPRHGGFSLVDQGRTAVVQSDRGLTLMLTSRRTPPFSLRQLTSCAVDPRSFRLIVAKGVNAPIAAYREVCRHFVRVDTPGATSADLGRLEYTRRRRPMYPFEPHAEWRPDGA